MLRYRVAILNIYQLCRCLYLAWSFDHAAAQPLKRCVSGLSGFTLIFATVAIGFTGLITQLIQ
jgi:hypothetical protein